MNTPVFLAGALSIILSAKASAVLIFSSTAERRLISFDSGATGTLLSDVPITGLTDPSESVQGIDFRPVTGQLYALGNAPNNICRLYTINPATGVATRVGSTDLTLTGAFWGFDFNPTVDRIRVVSDTGTNIRLHPDTGALVATDTILNAGAGTVTGIAAAAYDRNDINPATLTTLFAINSTTDQLVRIGGVDGTPSPNGGEVNIIGPLGVDTTGFAGLDIYNATEAFAALSFVPASLFTINLATGAATHIGVISTPGSIAGITGMAVVPEPAGLALGALTAAGFCLRRRRR